MNTQEQHTLHLHITVEQNRTILSRCLQVLNRRGFTLTDLDTESRQNGDAVLRCTVTGPSSWHDKLPLLLSKLIDVKKVEKV